MKKCPKCGSKEIEEYSWKSSDGVYEDHKYTCTQYPHCVWCEGSDS